MNQNNFDVIIIGAGPSGIFCAYELIEKKPDLKILMIEKGRPIEKRVCQLFSICQGFVQKKLNLSRTPPFASTQFLLGRVLRYFSSI